MLLLWGAPFTVKCPFNQRRGTFRLLSRVDFRGEWLLQVTVVFLSFVDVDLTYPRSSENQWLCWVGVFINLCVVVNACQVCLEPLPSNIC